MILVVISIKKVGLRLPESEMSNSSGDRRHTRSISEQLTNDVYRTAQLLYSLAILVIVAAFDLACVEPSVLCRGTRQAWNQGRDK